jgi:hypothetical protein
MTHLERRGAFTLPCIASPHSITSSASASSVGGTSRPSAGAVSTVKPALARFYDLLGDEQKARFNALRSAGSSA